MYGILFHTFYSQALNEMFIFSGKYHCSNSTFTDMFYVAANKEHLTK